jgi:hypothetical protein
VDHGQDLAARSGGTGPLTEVDQLVGGLLDPQGSGKVPLWPMRVV